MNLPILLAIAAGGYYLYNRAMNVNTFAKTVDYTIVPKNLKVRNFNIYFDLEITVLNPSSLGLRITNPLVQIFYDGVQLTRSTFNIPVLDIKPMAQTVLPVFQFTISITSNLFTFKKMLGQLMKGVTFTNLANAGEIIEKNQEQFYKLLTMQLTAYHNGTPYTKTIKLG
jgi:hypothetical protein